MKALSDLAAALAPLVLAVTACAGATTPATPPASAETVDSDRQAFVQALAPARGRRPVIAVIAHNEGTETTDFLVPHAVLQRADVATVEAVAVRPGRVVLMPALELTLADDLASFDRRHPDGADYVIVPAMHRDDDPVVLDWIRTQRSKGAAIVGICSGALVLGRAGLLDGGSFTGHWYDRGTLHRRHPTATYVPDRRYVAGGRVATTTGVTASIPAALALVEAIGGRSTAMPLAQALGVASWDPAHDSAAFAIDARRLWDWTLSVAMGWRQERIAVEVHDGADDIALALAADAWSRTYRSSAIAVAATSAPVRLRSGLALIPAAQAAARSGAAHQTLAARIKPAEQLDWTLCEIRQRYGARAQELVALQMEHRVDDRHAQACRQP